jgi:CO/xanthine dehydrogenase FAD-binding subunit
MLMEDVQASSEYRAQLLEAYTEKCLQAAVGKPAQ